MYSLDELKTKKIAVLYGGLSAERPVSLNSGQAVFDALVRQQFDVVAVDVKEDVAAQLIKMKPDLAFIALHGRGGEDGSIQGLLEWLEIPYTGSGVKSSATCMDKLKTKFIFTAAQLPTPNYELLRDDTDWNAIVENLGLPLIVKPAREGSSIGMAKVDSVIELQSAYENASKFDSVVFAEKWITGKEFTVGVLNGKALPVIGLETNNAFYDYDAKYVSNDTRYLLPSGLSQTEEAQLQKVAIDAFYALDCNGWGRVDFMQDGNGNFYLLEINTSPGMTDHSLVPMAAGDVGMSFSDLVVEILKSASLEGIRS